MPFDPSKVKKNAYTVIGVKPDATQDEIKKAYRRIALTHHPDRSNGNKESEEKFKEAAEAYDAIGNEENRASYDRYITGYRSRSSHNTSSSYNRSSSQTRSNPFEGFSEFEDLYEEMFGKGSSGFNSGSYNQKQANRKNGNVGKGETLNLDEDTVIIGDIEDNVTIYANGRIKVEGNIGSGVKIFQKNKEGEDTELTYGLEVTGAIKNNNVFETQNSFYAKNIGDNNHIKSSASTVFANAGDHLKVESGLDIKGENIGNDFNVSGNKVELKNIGNKGNIKSKSRTVIQNGGNDVEIDSGYSVIFESLKDKAKLSAKDEIKGGNIGDEFKISGKRVELKDMGQSGEINSTYSTTFANAGDHLKVESGLDVKGGNLGNKFDISGKGVELKNVGNDGRIKSTSRTAIQNGGNDVEIDSGYSITFESLKDKTKLSAKDDIKGGNIGNEFNISGKGVELKDVGNNGNIKSTSRTVIQNGGNDVEIDSGYSVTFESLKDKARFSAEDGIKGGNIGDDFKISGKRVELKDMGQSGEIKSTYSTTFANAGDHLKVESGLDVKGVKVTMADIKANAIDLQEITCSKLSAKNSISVNLADNASELLGSRVNVRNYKKEELVVNH